MLVDSAVLSGPSDVTVENVQALPSSPEEGQLVYLTVADGGYSPDLYMYSGSTWHNMIDPEVDPVS